MLDAVARGVYDRRATRYLLDALDLDLPARRVYARVRAAAQGTTELAANGVSVEVSRATVPSPTYLGPELAVLERLLGRVGPDDVFWDVGADKGLYACLVAAAGCESVVAFEPHPVRRRELTRNLRRNALTATIRPEALAGGDGEAPFNYRIETDRARGGDRTVAGSGAATAGSGAGGPSFTATLRRADGLVESGRVPPPTIAKLDVEGAEYEALRGMRDTLANPACRLVYCELHDADARGFDGGPEAVRELLEAHGFTVSTFATRSGDGWTQPYVEAVRR